MNGPQGVPWEICNKLQAWHNVVKLANFGYMNQSETDITAKVYQKSVSRKGCPVEFLTPEGQKYSLVGLRL